MLASPGRIARAVASVAFGVAVSLAPAHAETLADAVAQAYRTNPQLLAQRASTRATDEQLVQARSAYGPTLTARASRTYSYAREQLVTGPASSSATVNGFTGTVDQPLFTSGRLSGNIRLAKANIDEARENLRQSEAGVLNNVITAYISVLRDQALLKIAQENLELLTRQQSDTDARLRGRESTVTDLAQTRLRYNFALARVKEATAALETSRGQYLLNVGSLPGALAPPPPLPGLPATIEQAYATADASSPRIRAADGRERASRAAIGTARAELGPVVSLQANGGRDTISEFLGNRRDYFSGGIVATVPIFNSGLTSSRIREAKARNDEEWRLADQARREVHQAIAQSWDQLVSTRGTIRDYRNAVRDAEEAYAGAREQERAGVRTTLDVLDQTRDLLDARTALAQAEANDYLNQAALIATMGLLEAPLIIGVAAYDPQENLRAVRGVLIPPYHSVLHAADAILQGADRAAEPRDPAAHVVKPGSGPLPPEPVARPAP